MSTHTIGPKVLKAYYGIDDLAPFTCNCDRCGNAIVRGAPYVVFDGLWQHPSCPTWIDIIPSRERRNR